MTGPQNAADCLYVRHSSYNSRGQLLPQRNPEIELSDENVKHEHSQIEGRLMTSDFVGGDDGGIPASHPCVCLSVCLCVHLSSVGAKQFSLTASRPAQVSLSIQAQQLPNTGAGPIKRQ
jgi:hypothetical protein